MKTRYVLLAVLLLAAAGCASMAANQRAVSPQDVIYLTRHELGPEVIIKHLEATDSRFSLTTEDIVTLKEAGVDEQVIEAMIERSGIDPSFAGEPAWPPYASYGPLNGSRRYESYYFPLYESYSGYYPYPTSVYGPPYTRRSGLIGRFYDYAPPQYFGPVREDGARRDGLDGRSGQAAPSDPAETGAGGAE